MKRFLIYISLSISLFAQSETGWNYLSHHANLGAAVPNWTTYNMVEKGDTIFFAGSDAVGTQKFAWFPGTGTEVQWTSTSVTTENHDMTHNVGRVGNTISGLIYFGGGTTGGTGYSTSSLNLGKTISTITTSPSTSNIYTICSSPNYDSMYVSAAGQLYKTIDGNTFTALGGTIRSVLHGTQNGSDYIHASYYVKDTVWIGAGFNFAYNGFSDASNNDTVAVLYYVPNKGAVYVDKRNLGTNRMVKWFRGFGYAGHKLYALLDSPTDTSVNGLWRRDAPGTWTKCAIPNIGNAQAIGIAADTVNGRLFIALGKTTLDTALNRIWVYTPHNGQWKKLPRIGSPTAGQTYPSNPIHDTMAVSGSRLYYHANTNRLYVIVSGRYTKDALDGTTAAGIVTVYNPNGTSEFYMNYYNLDIPSELEITYPTGGIIAYQADTLVVTWTDVQVTNAKIYYRVNPSSNWVYLATSDSNSYGWIIPHLAYTTEAQIRITDTDSLTYDNSDEFAIIPTSFINIIYPCGLSSFSKYVGDTLKITFESINVDSVSIYWSGNGTAYHLITGIPIDTVNGAVFDTTIYTWILPFDTPDSLWIKIREAVDTTVYFTERQVTDNLGLRALANQGFQKPVWFSPPFQISSDYYTLSIKTIGWGWFGRSYAYLYKFNTSTDLWAKVAPNTLQYPPAGISSDSGAFVLIANQTSWDAPYPVGIVNWNRGTQGDTVFKVTDNWFITVGRCNVSDYRIIRFGVESGVVGISPCDCDSAIQKMNGMSALTYSDVTYLGRTYSYSASDTSVYMEDLTNDITQRLVKLKGKKIPNSVNPLVADAPTGNSLALDYGHIKLYRINDFIVITNEGKLSGAPVNYAFESLPIPYSGRYVAEDICNVYDSDADVHVMRDYFRGIYPKAIMSRSQLIQRRGR